MLGVSVASALQPGAAPCDALPRTEGDLAATIRESEIRGLEPSDERKRLRSASILASSLLTLGLLACGPDDGTDSYPVQAFTYDGQVYVIASGGDGASPRPAEWSIVTWPELVPVDAVVREPEVYPVGIDASNERIVYLEPSAPLEARWYAVRWMAEPRVGERVLGIPLADSSVVLRFHGAFETGVQELRVYGEPGAETLSAVFTGTVVIGPSASFPEVLTATQDGRLVCAGLEDQTGAGTNEVRGSCADANWAEPMVVAVEGMLSATTGMASPRIQITHTFGPGPEPRGLTLSSGAEPPPVPAALCAGVGCE